MLLTTGLVALLAVLPSAQAGFDFHGVSNFVRRSTSDIHRRARFAQKAKRKTFNLVDSFEGEGFFDQFTFNTFADPTHGAVNYLSESAAKAAGLAYVDGGKVVMAVDSTTHLPVGTNRNSIRVSSNPTYTHGLFIADIAHMPAGCSTWPAYWMVGPNWPNQGEIDIIENVNTASNNQLTLHTGAGCTLTTAPPGNRTSPAGATEAFTGHVLNAQCASSDTSNSGCSISDPDGRSYGAGFNNVGGGVYATLWDTTGIYIYFFPRSSIPGDISAGKPNPSNWGTPIAFWSSASCDMDSHFSDMSIVFDITLCGDWAGATYSSSGCPGSCASAVANPANYANAKWEINYVHVYQ